MLVKDVVFEDFVNYKKASMFIGFPSCSFKCEKECGLKCCQNSGITKMPDLNINDLCLINSYIRNPITSAIVCGGLEPFDTYSMLYKFIELLREVCDDDIVIYTGYMEDEISEMITQLKAFRNIIVKFGRFVPNMHPHFDSVLGVMLASDNQYAKKIS